MPVTRTRRPRQTEKETERKTEKADSRTDKRTACVKCRGGRWSRSGQVGLHTSTPFCRCNTCRVANSDLS